MSDHKDVLRILIADRDFCQSEAEHHTKEAARLTQEVRLMNRGIKALAPIFGKPVPYKALAEPIVYGNKSDTTAKGEK